MWEHEMQCYHTHSCAPHFFCSVKGDTFPLAHPCCPQACDCYHHPFLYISIVNSLGYTYTGFPFYFPILIPELSNKLD